MDLEDAGIGEGISEVIVTTQSASGRPNAAPIGVITLINGPQRGELRHFVKLYRGSQTLANVLETGLLAANVTSDALVFVETAFEDLSEDKFTVFARMPVLKEANAWVVFTSEVQEKRSGYLYFQIFPRAVEIRRKELRAINRGLNAVIEATILATRYGLVRDEREKEELQNQMERLAAIVETCGGRRERHALRILNEKVHQSYNLQLAPETYKK